MSAGTARWIVCSAIIWVAYVLLGRGLIAKRKIGLRTYRFAE